MGCFEEVAGRGVVTGKANGKVQVGKKRASVLVKTCQIELCSIFVRVECFGS
jgi:hypothetical protein